MSQNRAATSDQVTVRPDEQLAFAELVYADDDWLRAEFDAIVDAEFPDRSDQGRVGRPAPWRPGPPPGGWGASAPISPPRELGAPARPPARQRSPPLRRTR